jgi:hypothetical protein
MLAVLRAACEWTSLHGQLERNGLDTFVWGVKA